MLSIAVNYDGETLSPHTMNSIQEGYKKLWQERSLTNYGGSKN